MNKYLKNNKGITMISISVAIIILIIITNILIYNAKDSAYIKKLENMYSDIGNLKEKISLHYAKYGTIPINLSNEYMINQKEVKELIGLADSGKFYIIDLKEIDGLSLNYGRDYEKITGDLEISQISNFTDVYIINETSHNIFYVKGISVNGKNYYTNSQKDDTIVNLKYYDGIRIPENFTYISGTKNTGLKIKENTTKNEYIWVVENEKITQKPEIVKVKDEYEFIASVNVNKGYFLFNGNIEENVAYIPVDLGNWSDTYPIGTTYKDENNDTAYIPEGFKISLTPNMNTIYRGLVVKDKENNEYVWINVPKKITQNAQTDEDIEKALKEYTKEYNETEFKDIWYDSNGLIENDIGNDPSDTGGCGLTLQEYKELKATMLKSIKQKGGFYIGRYEAGTDIARTEGNQTATSQNIISTHGLPQSKEGLYPYNFVNIAQSELISKKLSENEAYKTGLMFGIQWDLVCKFIEITGEISKEEIKDNSFRIGNYYKQEFNITKGEYLDYNSNKYIKITQKHIKEKDKYELLTTGTTKRNMTINIYDLAGNVYEETLEQNKIKTGTMRGGSAFNNVQDDEPINGRERAAPATIGTAVGFRLAIY